MVLDTSEEKLEELRENPQFDAFDDLKNCAPQADIIFIAVKPYHAESRFFKAESVSKTWPDHDIDHGGRYHRYHKTINGTHKNSSCHA